MKRRGFGKKPSYTRFRKRRRRFIGRRKRRFYRRRGRRVKNITRARIVVQRRFTICETAAINLGTDGDPIRYASWSLVYSLGQSNEAIEESKRWEHYRIVGIKEEWHPWWTQGMTQGDYFQRPIPAPAGREIKYIMMPDFESHGIAPPNPCQMITAGGRIKRMVGPIKFYLKRPKAIYPLWTTSAEISTGANFGGLKSSPWIDCNKTKVVHAGIKACFFTEKNYTQETKENLTMGVFHVRHMYVQFKNRIWSPGMNSMAEHMALGTDGMRAYDDDNDENAPVEPVRELPDKPGGGDMPPQSEEPP